MSFRSSIRFLTVSLLTSCLFNSVHAFSIFTNSESEADEDAVEKVWSDLKDFASQSFRVREDLTVTLDGSEDAGGILKTSKTANKVVYIDRANWRSRRELPFGNAMQEVLNLEDHLFLATPTNRLVPAHEAISERHWMEVLASPLRLAQHWGLADSSMTLSEWIERLKKSKEPLKNVAGDQVEYKIFEDKTLQILSTGSLLHDGTTKILVQSVWELRDWGAINRNNLHESLWRSL